MRLELPDCGQSTSLHQAANARGGIGGGYQLPNGILNLFFVVKKKREGEKRDAVCRQMSGSYALAHYGDPWGYTKQKGGWLGTGVTVVCIPSRFGCGAPTYQSSLSDGMSGPTPGIAFGRIFRGRRT